MSLFDTVNEGKTFFDPGTYVATLLKLEGTEHKEYGPGIKWIMALSPDLGEPDDYVVKDDGETVAEFWDQTSRSMTPKAFARRNAEAFLNRVLEADEQLEADDLIGKTATITIADKKGTDGKMYSKVAAISPYKGKPAPVRTRTRAAPKVEVEDIEESEDGLPF